MSTDLLDGWDPVAHIPTDKRVIVSSAQNATKRYHRPAEDGKTPACDTKLIGHDSEWTVKSIDHMVFYGPCDRESCFGESDDCPAISADDCDRMYRLYQTTDTTFDELGDRFGVTGVAVGNHVRGDCGHDTEGRDD